MMTTPATRTMRPRDVVHELLEREGSDELRGRLTILIAQMDEARRRASSMGPREYQVWALWFWR